MDARSTRDPFLPLSVSVFHLSSFYRILSPSIDRIYTVGRFPLQDAAMIAPGRANSSLSDATENFTEPRGTGGERGRMRISCICEYTISLVRTMTPLAASLPRGIKPSQLELSLTNVMERGGGGGQQRKASAIRGRKFVPQLRFL